MPLIVACCLEERYNKCHTVMHLIYNPVAGRGRAKAALPLVEAHFRREDQALRIHTSAYSGHAKLLAAHLPHDAIILILGGDGTLHDVATPSLGTGRTLGLLPAGTGNDFAFALGIKTLSQALQVVRRASVKRIDSAEVNNQPFFNACGSGFDAEVAQRVRTAPGWLKGTSAYLYAIFATLNHFETPRVQVMADGQLLYNGPALLVSVHNGPRVGGAFRFTPDAIPDDGYLDVAIAGQFGRRTTLTLLPRVARGTHVSHPKVVLGKGRALSVRWDKPRATHRDGELMNANANLSIKIRPKSLKVFAK